MRVFETTSGRSHMRGKTDFATAAIIMSPSSPSMAAEVMKKQKTKRLEDDDPLNGDKITLLKAKDEEADTDFREGKKTSVVPLILAFAVILLSACAATAIITLTLANGSPANDKIAAQRRNVSGVYELSRFEPGYESYLRSVGVPAFLFKFIKEQTELVEVVDGGHDGNWVIAHSCESRKTSAKSDADSAERRKGQQEEERS